MESQPRAGFQASFLLEIFLVSAAVFLLEVSYTRIFSFKLFYYFTYLIIGVVMLGLGAGAVFVALFARLRDMPADRLIPGCCLAAGVSVALGYAVVAAVQIEVLQVVHSPAELARLAVVVASLLVPFTLAGIVLATIFGARPDDIGRLYFSDLMGAALACALAVPLMRALTPPGAVVAAGCVFALVAVRLYARERRPVFWASAVAAAALAAGALIPGALPEPVADPIKSMSPQRLKGKNVLFSQWDPVFRIDVLGWRNNPALYVVHDGIVGSGLHRFRGDLSALSHFDESFRALPFEVLEKGPRVLIIGAAGGHEILASLYYGAREIVGVELNPVTVSLLEEHFLDYTGRIALHDRVTLVNDEGRSFLGRDDSRYDLIWFVAPDSYAAMNTATSGAFVMSESYLYTSEMIRESLEHLAPGGVVCAQFGEHQFRKWPTRTTRYLATARDALSHMGIRDFERHVLLSTAPGVFTNATILLKRDPFTPDEVERFRSQLARVERGELWHPRDDAAAEALPATRPIRLNDTELAAWLQQTPYAVDAIDDDSPFFWHFARFGDLLGQLGRDPGGFFDPELGTGERMLLVLLCLVVLFGAVFLLLPLVVVGDVWRQIPHKTPAAIYFAALGLGFMFFEVPLLQSLTLFLGYPTYALTVTLFCLLAFSGIGSQLSTRYVDRRNRALPVLFAVLAVLTAFYQLGMPPLVAALVGSPLPVRVLVTAVCLAPLGLALGAFLPIGIATVSGVTVHQKEFVAWAWATNGFFSVLSSVLSTILAMSFGFTVVLYLGLGVYAVGILALLRIPAPAQRRP